MSATVTDAGPFEKLVEFTLAEAEIESAKTPAARRLSRDMKIRGFRPGKAPRPIVEAAVGAERLRAEAIDDVLPQRLGAVLDELDLEPAVTPSLESMEDVDDGVEVRVRVTLWPKLETVPEYEGREIEVGSPEVDDEDIEEQIDRIRAQFADLTESDGPARSGDYVTIDVSATRDGDDVPEASASELLYEVGSGNFVEGIDERLEGAEKGSTITFDGTLPDGFGELSGTEVTFRVDVGDIRSPVLPELTDEWVAEITEFSSVAELEINLETRMGQMKRQALATKFREQALDELVDQVEVELPDALVRSEMDEVLHRFAHRLEDQGISLDDYFAVAGVDREQFVEDLRSQAERSVRTRLLLEGVAERSGLEVGDEELAALVETVALQSENPDEVRQALRGGPQEKSLVGDILRNRALGVILAGATAVDEDGVQVDLELDTDVDVTDVDVTDVDVTDVDVTDVDVTDVDGIVDAEGRSAGDVPAGVPVPDDGPAVPAGEVVPGEVDADEVTAGAFEVEAEIVNAEVESGPSGSEEE